MILLDTDVISEVMRHQPDARVIAWMDRQPAASLFLSAITVDEITFGIRLLPSGRRRRRLTRVFSQITDLFSGRILGFDEGAAVESARFRAERRLLGKPMGHADAQIAGVAKSRGMALATRNARDFRELDLAVLEPR